MAVVQCKTFHVSFTCCLENQSSLNLKTAFVLGQVMIVKTQPTPIRSPFLFVYLAVHHSVSAAK